MLFELIQHVPFTMLIIAINLFISFNYFKMFETQRKTYRLYPYAVARGQNRLSILTSMFIHSTWLHFGVNMFSIYIFGQKMELILGSIHYLLIYFLSGIVGSFFLIAKYKNISNYSALGASGAASGIVYGYIMINPFTELQLLFIPIPIPAWFLGIGFLAYSYIQANRMNDGIAHEAHIGGALTGIIYVLLLANGFL